MLQVRALLPDAGVVVTEQGSLVSCARTMDSSLMMGARHVEVLVDGTPCQETTLRVLSILTSAHGGADAYARKLGLVSLRDSRQSVSRIRRQETPQ